MSAALKLAMPALALLLSPLPETAAQDRSAQKAKPVAVKMRHKDRAVTVIKTEKVSLRPVLANPRENDGMKVRASIKRRPDAKPSSGASNKLKAPPSAKLKFKLTPRKPALQGRGYLSYNYPNRVSMTEDHNYAMFSKGNIPGSLHYHVRLVEGRKYLVELEVMPEQSGGHVEHDIGDVSSNHELGKFKEMVNISRVVTPEATGWVSGRIAQANTQPPGFWRVYSVSVTELD